jgi:hypothetical protein
LWNWYQQQLSDKKLNHMNAIFCFFILFIYARLTPFSLLESNSDLESVTQLAGPRKPTIFASIVYASSCLSFNVPVIVLNVLVLVIAQRLQTCFLLYCTVLVVVLSICFLSLDEYQQLVPFLQYMSYWLFVQLHPKSHQNKANVPSTWYPK